MSLHLLISARDPGAASHLSRVARFAMADPDWRVTVLAAPPAHRVFSASGVPFRRITAQGSSLRRELRSLLGALQPDAVLAGLSGPDAGLDEALLEVSEGIPRYLFQDYWGDLNPAMPKDVGILCVDQVGVDQTRVRHGRHGRAVGSPAHDDWPLPRRARRHGSLPHRLGPGGPVIGLCDQPLWREPAYRATLRRALLALPRGRLLIRAHPRTGWQERLRLRRLLRQTRGWRGTVWDDQSRLPGFLASCDVVLSVFSNCALDAAHYSRYPGHTGTLPLNLLFEPGMYRHYRHCSGFERTPVADAGMAWDLRRRSSVAARLRAALDPGLRHRYRHGLRGKLRGGAAGALLALLEKDLQDLHAVGSSGSSSS